MVSKLGLKGGGYENKSKYDPNSSLNDFSTTKAVIAVSSDRKNLVLFGPSECFHLAGMVYQDPVWSFQGQRM